MTQHKVVYLPELLAELARRRDAGQTVVWTNGCFDLLHGGHVVSLEAAKAAGDVLVVAVNSDAGIRRLKGPARPIIAQQERVRMLAALACVDYVVVFDEETPARLIEAVRPHVLAKSAKEDAGGVAGRDFVESYGGTFLATPVLHGLSTTARIAAICDAYRRDFTSDKEPPVPCES